MTVPAWALSVAELPHMGQSERVYQLAPENGPIRGMAFDDTSPKAPRLFVLDRSGKVFKVITPVLVILVLAAGWMLFTLRL